MFNKILKKPAQIKNTLLSTLISRIIKKLFVSPEVSEAFYVTEHWLDLFILQSWLMMARIFKTYTVTVHLYTKHPDGQEFDLCRR